MEAPIRYHPNSEQLALASTMDESLDVLLPLSRLHSGVDESANAWSSLREIGIFGVTVSEESGGSGLGVVEEVLIVTGLGRRLASPAVLATIGAGLAMRSAGVADQNVAAAYRRGDRIIMAEEAQANLVLVRATDSATLYRLGARSAKTVDRRLWLAELGEIDTPAQALAHFDVRDLLRLRLLDAAALAGIAAATLDMSVAYATVREQFGRPIGTFQAVKHHCANMAMAARCARDQTNFAAVALDDRRDDAALQVESALLVAGQAALDNAARNIQLHGGIGFSDEADPHLFLKRAQLLVAIAGGLEAANARIAALDRPVQGDFADGHGCATN